MMDDMLKGVNKVRNKYYSPPFLKDKEILATLKKACIMYENGEILEVRDELTDIVSAINEFEEKN